MLTPAYKNKFQKDLKKAIKRGKPVDKIKKAMKMLVAEQPLPRKYYDHQLKGEYTDCRECHIEPDWLLIYLINGNEITFVRTGSHSDLFK